MSVVDLRSLCKSTSVDLEILEWGASPLQQHGRFNLRKGLAAKLIKFRLNQHFQKSPCKIEL